MKLTYNKELILNGLIGAIVLTIMNSFQVLSFSDDNIFMTFIKLIIIIVVMGAIIKIIGILFLAYFGTDRNTLLTIITLLSIIFIVFITFSTFSELIGFKYKDTLMEIGYFIITYLSTLVYWNARR